MKYSVLLLLYGILFGGVLRGGSTVDTTARMQVGTEDLAARKVVRECSACHTIGGGKLKGPDLITAITWKPEDLIKAVKKMEKEVGAMSDETIAGIVSLLKDPALKSRLAAEEQRSIQSRRAHLAAPNASIGYDIFWGARRLQNGGLHCSACHTLNGTGGTLGPDLTPVSAKIGEVALSSAIEKASFKVMEPHYRTRPVTPQEALHLSAYLSQATQYRTSADLSFHLIAIVAAAGLSGIIVALYTSAGKKQSTSGK